VGSNLFGEASKKGLQPSRYKHPINDRSISGPVPRMLRYYAVYGNASGSVLSPIQLHKDFCVPEEKKVEDAGLFDGLDE